MSTYGNSGVAEHPAHAITDSTKLSDYQMCPRRDFYANWLGWQLDEPSVDLICGSAMHLAWERLLWLAHRDGGSRPEHLDEAFPLFEAEYRKHFNVEDDAARSPKDPASVRWAMAEWLKAWANDRYTPIFTEVAGSVPLDADGRYWVYFKIDALLRDHNRNDLYVVRDLKSGKATSMKGRYGDFWLRKWALTIQFTVYTHAMLCTLPPNELWGVEVDGVGLCSPVERRRRDGEIYAADKDKAPVLLRANVRYLPDTMEANYWTVHKLFADRQADLERLADDSPSNPIMRSFPQNWSACGAYGGCPYLAFCTARSNPLQHSLEPPIGFEHRIWNPLENQSSAHALLTFDPSAHTATITPVAQETVNV